MEDKQTTVHKSVLLQETIENLKVKDGGVYVDSTLGGGGHSKVICESASDITLIGLDADSDAIKRAGEVLEPMKCTKILEVTPNHLLDEILEKHQIDKVDGFLFDLGMSSDQLDQSGRGFSFTKDEPLLMTMKADPNERDITAYEIINTWEENSITDILRGYGEERFARKIAHKICEARDQEKIRTTGQLVEIINSAVPNWYKHKKTHPATRTFQALRIAANNELENLKVALEKAFNSLKVGGRIAVITFHSLEDRIVKRYFRELKDSDKANLITKKPIKPTELEINNNPRARSALLRVIEKR